MSWINKDTEIYCSFAENAGNTGCQMMNTAFHYYGLNKIYRTKKTVENPNSFYLDIGLTNTGCAAQLTIPSAANASGNFLS